MLMNPEKFGDDRTQEQKEADRIAKKAKLDMEIADVKARYPERFDETYSDYLNYIEDLDALDQY